MTLLAGASAARASDEQQDPVSELARVEAQLGEVAAERDALPAEKEAGAEAALALNHTMA